MDTKLKYVIISIAIIVLALLSLYFFWNPSEHNFFPKCPFYSFTGIYCAGCGSQRAFHEIINGQIITGVRHNYLLLIVFLVVSYKAILFALNRLFNKTYFDLFHKPLASKVVLILVLLFWVLRNIRIYPFTELAP